MAKKWKRGDAMSVRCAWRTGEHRFPGFRVNEFFAVREAVGEDLVGGWWLIHLPTGYSAGYVFASRERAERCADALLKHYGRRWKFTKPETVRGWKKAKAITKSR